MAEIKQREALFYEQTSDKVRCQLCPHFCLLAVGESGLCRGRKNIDGTMITVNYGNSIGISLDPIEKKPLYHFRPGSQILSLGANSCNLGCFFCQNSDSSQSVCVTRQIIPEQLLDLVREYAKKDIRQVAFTYTEPFTWYEYIYDFAILAKDVDIVLVTNGFINPEPLEKLLPHVKAMNIDLKSINDDFYHMYCGAALHPVLHTIKHAYEHNVHLELTNLLIPGLNDEEEDIRDLAEFVASIDKDIPLHFSAYHPAFKSTIPATPASTILHACKLASEVLSYVYAGNIMSEKYQETKCPRCGIIVVDVSRQKVQVDANGCCLKCSHKIYGVF